MTSPSCTPTIACNPEGLPHELREYRQWVVWKNLPADKPGDKPRKVLFNPKTGKTARTHDGLGKTYADRACDTWSTYEEAVQAFHRGGWAGLGFVFTEADPFCGGDIDDCRDPETGDLTENAQWAVSLANTYTEVSQSGKGIKFIGRADKIGTACKRGDVEMYDRARFFALTGCRLADRPPTVEERQALFAALYYAWFPEEDKPKVPTGQVYAEPPVPSNLSDAELLEQIRRSDQGAKFDALWRGDASGCRNDQSSADLTLCCILAWWCDHDEHRIDSLFRASGLIRAKWDEMRGSLTYGARTVSRAMQSVPRREARHVRRSEPLAAPTGAEPLIEKGNDATALAGLPVTLVKMGAVIQAEASEELKETILSVLHGRYNKEIKRYKFAIGDAVNALSGGKETKAKRLRQLGFDEGEIQFIFTCGWVAGQWPLPLRHDDERVKWSALVELSDQCFTQGDRHDHLQRRSTVAAIRRDKEERKGEQPMTEAKLISHLVRALRDQGRGGEIVAALQTLAGVKSHSDVAMKIAPEDTRQTISNAQMQLAASLFPEPEVPISIATINTQYRDSRYDQAVVSAPLPPEKIESHSDVAMKTPPATLACDQQEMPPGEKVAPVLSPPPLPPDIEAALLPFQPLLLAARARAFPCEYIIVDAAAGVTTEDLNIFVIRQVNACRNAWEAGDTARMQEALRRLALCAEIWQVKGEEGEANR